MKYQITQTGDTKIETHLVHVDVTDVPDHQQSYSSIVIAPTRVIIRWERYDDREWGKPKVAVIGKGRLKGGGLGADRKNSHASITEPWIAELIEELKPA